MENKLYGRKYYAAEADTSIRLYCCLHKYFQRVINRSRLILNNVRVKPQMTLSVIRSKNFIFSRERFDIGILNNSMKRDSEPWGELKEAKKEWAITFTCLICGDMIINQDDIDMVFNCFRLGGIDGASGYVEKIGFHHLYNDKGWYEPLLEDFYKQEMGEL